jgi:hypothetical protein
MGIGDWGLGIGPIPNPHLGIKFIDFKKKFLINFKK